MTARAYYNENDKFAAAWLRELIKAGQIADGDVDERSIEDVKPTELKGYSQCHFFAGIGGWSYALRQAGWGDDRQVWTGSCPCQSFSTAGKRAGFDDKRHLWPVWFELIKECRPNTIFGEQVEAAIRYGWLDTVQADLEGCDYAVGAVVLPACGFGAPHRRQRLYFAGQLADSADIRREQRRTAQSVEIQGDDPERGGQHTEPGHEGQLQGRPEGLCRAGVAELDNAANEGLQERSGQEISGEETRSESERPGNVNGYWKDAEWIWCLDNCYRPVESGTFPLVDGATNRVGRLRGYGNAIVAPVATAFIKAYIDATK